MGAEGVEYYVASQTSEGGRYGFACTSVTPHDFSSGTIGLNLRGESNQANCYVQTYAAASGTNHRSFWTLNEVSEDIVTGQRVTLEEHKVFPKEGDLEGGSFDLLGRPATRHNKGIQVQRGKTVFFP